MNIIKNRSHVYMFILVLYAVCAPLYGTNAQTGDSIARDLTPAQIDALPKLLKHLRLPAEMAAVFDVPPTITCPETYGSLGFYKSSFSLMLPSSAMTPTSATAPNAFSQVSSLPREVTSGWVLANSTCAVEIEISVKALVDGKWKVVPVAHKDGINPP